MAARQTKVAMNFKRMPAADVPNGRNGKHKSIVSKILSDLDHAEPGVALKVPLAQLPESKEKVRSALNRASRKEGRHVATASDDTYLYVWNETE
jgi:hypothetical protein